MATSTVHVRLVTLDPVAGAMIPVPGAQVKVRHDGAVFDRDLSDPTGPTGADGQVAIQLEFDDGDEDSLNPYFEVSLEGAARTMPPGAPEERRFELPASWRTRHDVGRRARGLLAHDDAGDSFEIVIGLPARLRLAYADFDPSGERNPLALPEDTLRAYLLDEDCLFDDTLKGVTADLRNRRIVEIGQHREYPYTDPWPTAPAVGTALVDSARTPYEPPRSWLDPPGAPVGQLGGGSFHLTGPIATDGYGAVYLVDDRTVQRFDPDGTLAESLELPDRRLPRALALDRRRNLYVADANDVIHVFTRSDVDDPSDPTFGRHVHDGFLAVWEVPGTDLLTDSPESLRPVTDLAVVGTAEGKEFLVVASPDDPDGGAVVLELPFRSGSHIFIPSTDFTATGIRLGAGEATAPGQPVAVAGDRRGHVFVADADRHQVSCWRLAADGESATREALWGRGDGTAGAGAGELDGPAGLAADFLRGFVYVLETGNGRISRLDTGSGDAELLWTPEPLPHALAVDPRGEIYLAAGRRVEGEAAAPSVRRYTPWQTDGRPQAATAEPRTVGDPWRPDDASPGIEPARPAAMAAPEYLAFDAGGGLWVSDTGHRRVLAFRRDTGGRLVPAPAPALELDEPVGLARAQAGDLFVVERGANRIRHFAPDLSEVDTIEAGLDRPGGLALAEVEDTGVVLFVADTGNNRVVALAPDGTVAGTFAGFDDPEAPKDAEPSPFDGPRDVALAADGHLYVADTGGARLVCLVLALSQLELGVQRGFALSREMPAWVTLGGVSVDPEGRLLVTDPGAHAVYRFDLEAENRRERWDLESLLRLSLRRTHRARFAGTIALSAALRSEATEPFSGAPAQRVTTAGTLTVTATAAGTAGSPQTVALPVGSILLVQNGATVDQHQLLAGVPEKTIFEPELARRLVLAGPARAVADGQGLLAIADTGQNRVRLVRTATHLDANLFDIGEARPDVSLRIESRGDWREEMGLKAAVGVGIHRFGDPLKLATDPDSTGREDFAGDEIVERQRFGPRERLNEATNVLRVARQMQRMMVHLTQTDDGNHPWGEQRRRLLVDLSRESESSHAAWNGTLRLTTDTSGKGSDAWDDSTIGHEMGHYVFYESMPGPQLLGIRSRYCLPGAADPNDCNGSHTNDQIIDQLVALVEGYAEYLQLFWGSEFSAADRLRGFPHFDLGGIGTGTFARGNRTSRFDSPGRALDTEGYLANALWQIHHALIDPGLVFADAPTYWHPFNTCVTATESRRLVDLLRASLRELGLRGDQRGNGSSRYLVRILEQAHAAHPECAQIVQSISELNNLLMPSLTVRSGDSEVAQLAVPAGENRALTVRLSDAADRPLRGYVVRLRIDPGDPAHLQLPGGAGPVRRRGAAEAETSHRASDHLRATNVDGEITATFTAPGDAAGQEEVVTISYRPDFLTDETFAPPAAASDWHDALRRLYLHELGVDQSTRDVRFGATVAATVRITIT